MWKWGAFMSTLKEIAVEYRMSAAKLSLRIRELKCSNADPGRVKVLQEMLRDTREVQRAISRYYELPRQGWVTSVEWKARGPSQDDH
uniref:Uncharacterized protein n=1 Tax=Siphoviridae sp. ctP6113 TaxID=2826318 RepID=A0A8S5MTR0_9CAUD|nr:MAG TPA: hypothetical protein [Siphoviridae sp. ctP6113]